MALTSFLFRIGKKGLPVEFQLEVVVFYKGVAVRVACEFARVASRA